MSKPKIKISKAVSSRFKITKTGKLLAGRSFSSHLKRKKRKGALRDHRKMKEMTGSYAKKIKQALGHA